MKGINLRINEFKQNLTLCINSAQLPPGIIQPILEGALSQIINQNANAIMQEQSDFEKEGEADGQSVSQ